MVLETSNGPKQAQHFSTRRKVHNGNSRVHQDLPDSREMGIVDRSVGRLPAHPHPSKLKEIPKVLLQVSGIPVHLPPIRTSHSPPGRVATSLYIVKSTLYFWQNGKLLFITLYFRHYSLFLGKLSIYSLFLVWKL